MTRRRVKLIAPDRNGILSYQGNCKVIIDCKMSKMLKIEPKNREFFDISVMFEWKWKFIQQKNLLFVFAENNLQDFVLIFANEEICKKVHDAIYKNREKDFVENEELQQRFLIPFFRKMSQRFKRIIIDWIDKQEEKEKMELLQLLKENEKIVDAKNVTHESNDRNARKRRLAERNDANYRKKNNTLVIKDVKCEIDDEVIQTKSKEVLFENVAIIDESKFKIVNFKSRGGIFRKLLIFTSSGRKKCYEFNFQPKKETFYHRCKNESRNGIKAILAVDENGNECIKMENKKHVCSPIKYHPERYIEMTIIKKPYYNIMENCSTQSRRMLITFDTKDRIQCYEYYWSSCSMKFECCGCASKGKKILAEVCRVNTEYEYIRLIYNEHICEIRKYDPKKFYKTNNFVLSPNFEVQTYIKDGNEKKTLIIFDENDRKLCYSYYYSNTSHVFCCSGCSQNGKTVSAKICQNSEGEEYVIPSNAAHICSSKKYFPQKEIILRPPKVKFMEANEKHTSKLFIFDSEDDQWCYIFSQRSEKNTKRYYCLGCRNLIQTDTTIRHGWQSKKGVYAFLYNDPNGGSEYFVKMNGNEKHFCKPQKYNPEKYETKILKSKKDYILFRENHNDLLGLVIYHPNNKSLGYKYSYQKSAKLFRCLECQKNGSSLTTSIHQDLDGKEYLAVDLKKHVCKPLKYSSVIKAGTVILEKSGLILDQSKNEVDESRILRLPKFELQRNLLGVPERKLIVFKSDDKELCYEYEYNYKFKCKKCQISATLHIDSATGEKYILLNKKEHSCKPVKYVAEKKIIETPDFMIFNRDDDSKPTKLILFTSSTKETFYEYTFLPRNKTFRCCGCYAAVKTTISAKLMKDDHGNECVQLLNNNHFCVPRKFILEEFQPKTIAESDFLICSNKNGKPNSKLIIFDSQKEGYGYEYYLEKKTCFTCIHCLKKNKRVTAKPCEKENGEKYLELSLEEHLCESVKYDARNSNQKKILLKNFVVQHNKDGVPNSRITIFDENDITCGYQYSFHKSKDSFFCCGCKMKKKSTTVKSKTDEEGKQSFEYGQKEHRCSIQNFKEKNLIFDNFKFEENGIILITNGLKNKKYKFKYNSNIDAFCCMKCKEKKKKIITATICKGNDEKEFVLLNEKHCCYSLLK